MVFSPLTRMSHHNFRINQNLFYVHTLHSFDSIQELKPELYIYVLWFTAIKFIISSFLLPVNVSYTTPLLKKENCCKKQEYPVTFESLDFLVILCPSVNSSFLTQSHVYSTWALCTNGPEALCMPLRKKLPGK